MNIDLGAVYARQVSYADLMRNVQHADLYAMTDELFGVIELLLAGSTDAAVLFVPHDPAASDQSEQGWTKHHLPFSHVPCLKMRVVGTIIVIGEVERSIDYNRRCLNTPSRLIRPQRRTCFGIRCIERAIVGTHV
jgi:hypothetical protein